MQRTGLIICDCLSQYHRAGTSEGKSLPCCSERSNATNELLLIAVVVHLLIVSDMKYPTRAVSNETRGQWSNYYGRQKMKYPPPPRAPLLPVGHWCTTTCSKRSMQGVPPKTHTSKRWLPRRPRAVNLRVAETERRWRACTGN